jgi:hypothetical protein
MKLTKKQLSASYAVTVALPRDNDGVANHRDSRLDGCSVASPKGKVESIPRIMKGRPFEGKVSWVVAATELTPGRSTL